MKHYVVTGGAGFIGSALVRRLLKEGAEKVTVIDNLLTGHRKRTWKRSPARLISARWTSAAMPMSRPR